MKKMLMLLGASLLTANLWAACMGPFCYDDTGASVAGLPVNGNGIGLPVLSSTTINALTPYIGQHVVCNTCPGNSSTNSYEECFSTGTVAKSFVFVSSTTKVCK